MLKKSKTLLVALVVIIISGCGQSRPKASTNRNFLYPESASIPPNSAVVIYSIKTKVVVKQRTGESSVTVLKRPSDEYFLKTKGYLKQIIFHKRRDFSFSAKRALDLTVPKLRLIQSRGMKASETELEKLIVDDQDKLHTMSRTVAEEENALLDNQIETKLYRERYAVLVVPQGGYQLILNGIVNTWPEKIITVKPNQVLYLGDISQKAEFVMWPTSKDFSQKARSEEDLLWTSRSEAGLAKSLEGVLLENPSRAWEYINQFPALKGFERINIASQFKNARYWVEDGELLFLPDE